jgi:hypothetical protein
MRPPLPLSLATDSILTESEPDSKSYVFVIFVVGCLGEVVILFCCVFLMQHWRSSFG